ncbi:hypothetical protein M3M35_04565 [Fructilactobacillus myrtifloralis]|uniref:Uncharacterized protein n=1 Tax=Fructilactobacillus myrtifloralis TaxID=2940301 RepID=A0ABY5BNC0_9LACO|nr:hypothetical protein [Fructilactobacillus myrtifloralis]USS84593.1 hypothetical protein M3M35_04565 [Fructilactobacillus myrtifloralis]
MENNFMIVPNNEENRIKVNNFINNFKNSAKETVINALKTFDKEYNIKIEWKYFLLGESEKSSLLKPLKSPFIAISNCFILYGSFDYDGSSKSISNMGYMPMSKSFQVLLTNDSIQFNLIDKVQFYLPSYGYNDLQNLYKNIKIYKNKSFDTFKKLDRDNTQKKLNYEKVINKNIRVEKINQKLKTIVDSRFNGDVKYLISRSAIPKGFKYSHPVLYTKSVSSFMGDVNRYGNCFNAIINGIKKDIDQRNYDALFNMNINTQSTQNDFDMILYGDATVIDEDANLHD